MGEMGVFFLQPSPSVSAYKAPFVGPLSWAGSLVIVTRPGSKVVVVVVVVMGGVGGLG